MKATVRFDDVFEGDGYQDIYDQVLDYLREVVFSGDLEAFEIDATDGPQLRIDLNRTQTSDVRQYGHDW